MAGDRSHRRRPRRIHGRPRGHGRGGSHVEAEAQATVEAEADAETQAVAEDASPDDAPSTEDEAGGDLFSIGVDAPADEADPRLDALGLAPDFAAAEAEAAAFSADETPAEEIAVIADEALAARLAGLVPDSEGTTESASTKLIVTGLVSVASIAGFKRHLSRVSGIQSVGVSSGPDGEFIFAVGHAPDVSMKDVIATLPGLLRPRDRRGRWRADRVRPRSRDRELTSWLDLPSSSRFRTTRRPRSPPSSAKPASRSSPSRIRTSSRPC